MKLITVNAQTDILNLTSKLVQVNTLVNNKKGEINKFKFIAEQLICNPDLLSTINSLIQINTS